MMTTRLYLPLVFLGANLEITLLVETDGDRLVSHRAIAVAMYGTRRRDVTGGYDMVRLTLSMEQKETWLTAAKSLIEGSDKLRDELVRLANNVKTVEPAP